jgi:hypothetical protein
VVRRLKLLEACWVPGTIEPRAHALALDVGQRLHDLVAMAGTAAARLDSWTREHCHLLERNEPGWKNTIARGKTAAAQNQKTQ